MNLPHYNYLTNDFQDYEFYSEGPKGNIKKLVAFTKIQHEPLIYNLAFGDADPDTGLMNDQITSNNDDRDVVLATVANTINDFCDHYGNHFIYATGSTPVRTRLYQIGINGLLDEISTTFDVYGIIGDNVYPFEKNVNYNAFLIKRK